MEEMTEEDLEMAARHGGTYYPPPQTGPGGEDLDDDGRKKRTGTVWTASAHIITAVIGSGVLSLAWSTAQLGWVAGPVTLMIFSFITYYTSILLADCYRSGDCATGKRNYTYMDAVAAYLGPWQVWSCGIFQYVNLVGTAVGYTITASISAAAIHKANCFHKKGHGADCSQYVTMYMVAFGIVQIFFSQLPNFNDLSWLSILAAIMSFSYSSIAVGLSLARTISGGTGGTEVGLDVDSAQKIWVALQALGNIAFAYSYSMILIEIQDTVKSPPAENKTMKKATLLGVSTTTAFYMLAGCLGYSAFGNAAPGNILTGFGFYEPYWLIDFANVCIVVHLVGAYQVFSQPIFAAVETDGARLALAKLQVHQQRAPPSGRQVPRQHAQADVADGVCGGEHSARYRDALLQRHTRLPWRHRVLAAHGVLPGGNVHPTAADKEVQHQVAAAGGAQLPVLPGVACLGSRVHRGRHRIAQALCPLQDQIMMTEL